MEEVWVGGEEGADVVKYGDRKLQAAAKGRSGESAASRFGW
jgi:hypothetical protein